MIVSWDVRMGRVFHSTVVVLCFSGELVNHYECGYCAMMCIVKSSISPAEITFSRVG